MAVAFAALYCGMVKLRRYVPSLMSYISTYALIVSPFIGRARRDIDKRCFRINSHSRVHNIRRRSSINGLRKIQLLPLIIHRQEIACLSRYFVSAPLVLAVRIREESLNIKMTDVNREVEQFPLLKLRSRSLQILHTPCSLQGPSFLRRLLERCGEYPPHLKDIAINGKILIHRTMKDFFNVM